MITVKQVREAGFSFITGDLVHRQDINEFIPISQTEAHWINNGAIDVDDSEVKGFIWRHNNGEAPCNLDLIVDYKGNNGIESTNLCERIRWELTQEKSSNGAHYAIVGWKPSLENWNDSRVETPEEAEAFDAIKTTADNLVKSLARSLPEVGYKFKYNEDEGLLPEKFSWLISDKYGWEQDDEIEVVKHIENHEGEMVAVCLNTQPDVLNSACLTADFFETEAERNERDRNDLVNDICEQLFGDMAEQCRPDVVGTIHAMLDAGFTKAVTNE